MVRSQSQTNSICVESAGGNRIILLLLSGRTRIYVSAAQKRIFTITLIIYYFEKCVSFKYRRPLPQQLSVDCPFRIKCHDSRSTCAAIEPDSV